MILDGSYFSYNTNMSGKHISNLNPNNLIKNKLYKAEFTSVKNTDISSDASVSDINIYKISGRGVIFNQLAESIDMTYTDAHGSNITANLRYPSSNPGRYYINGVNQAKDANGNNIPVWLNITPNYNSIIGHYYYIYGVENANYLTISNGMGDGIEDDGTGVVFQATINKPFYIKVLPNIDMVNTSRSIRPQIIDLTLFFGQDVAKTLTKNQCGYIFNKFIPYTQPVFKSIVSGRIYSVNENLLDCNEFINAYPNHIRYDESESQDVLTIKASNGNMFLDGLSINVKPGYNISFDIIPQDNIDVVALGGRVLLKYDDQSVENIYITELTTGKQPTFGRFVKRLPSDKGLKAICFNWSVTNASQEMKIANLMISAPDTDPNIYIRHSHTTIDVSEFENKYFPNGMYSFGNICDELDFRNKKANMWINSVNLGSLTWEKNGSSTNIYVANLPSGVKWATSNSDRNKGIYINNYQYAVSDDAHYLANDTLLDKTYIKVNNRLFVKDSSVSTASAFKTKVNNINLYYEMAEPIVTPITESVTTKMLAYDNGFVVKEQEYDIPTRTELIVGLKSVESIDDGVFESSKYGLVFGHLDTSESNSLYSSKDIEVIHNKNNNRFLYSGFNDSQSRLSLEAEIIKLQDKCGVDYDGSDKGDILPYIPEEDLKYIEQVLFKNNGFGKLYINDLPEYNYSKIEYTNDIGEVQEYTNKAYLDCIFTNPERIIDDANHTIGYKVMIECSSNMLIQEPITITHTNSITELINGATIYVDTDDVDNYVYPKITITPSGSNNKIEVYNASDDEERITLIEDVTPGINIVIDGGINYISPIVANGSSRYPTFKGYKFPRLKAGINQLVFTGEYSLIRIEWNNKKFIR